MKIIWCSDIHLNFLTELSRQEYYKKIAQASTSKSDVIVISGDIAESHCVIPFIKGMEAATGLLVCFVLGNHDFYGSSIKDVRKLSSKLDGYLAHHPVELFRDHTILLGVDGWGDCRYGDYENSHLTMSDWLYIDELRSAYGTRTYLPRQGSDALKETLQDLADRDAKQLAKNVRKAVKSGYKRIIMVTHVPPFEEACLYAGKKSTPGGLPFFASKCLGEAILPIAKKNPDIDFLWLSGHTHSRAEYKPCDNMTVRVAKSEYYFPQIEDVFELPECVHEFKEYANQLVCNECKQWRNL